MIVRQRIGRFKGSTTKYVQYLEQRVFHLEAQVQLLRQQVPHEHTVTLQNQPSAQPSTQPSNQSPGRFIFQTETPSQTAKTTEPSSELWKAATKEFIRAVPKNEKDWADRRKQVGLHQPEAAIHTFCLLTRHSQQLSYLNIGDAPGTEASILNILSDYQVFTSVLGAEKAYATQVSNYSTLLFVGLSIVAFSVGTDPEEVENHMRKFLTHQQRKVCTAKGSYLSKLRTAALWPIKRMDELYEKGLKHRSWEIFVLCGPSIHSYRKFAECKGAQRFTSEVTICEPPDGESQADVPFHIAFLIKFILGDRCSLNDINKALGTQLRQETFNAWAHALSARIQSLSRPRKRRKMSHMGVSYEERDNSYTEARSGGDVCFTPKTATVDPLQDDLGGIVDRLERLILEPPPDGTDGRELRDTSEHCRIVADGHRDLQLSSRPDSTIQEPGQMYFDSNELPSAAAAIPSLDFGDDQMLLGLDLGLLETYHACSPVIN